MVACIGTEVEEKIRSDIQETEIQPEKIFCGLYCGAKFPAKKEKYTQVKICTEKNNRCYLLINVSLLQLVHPLLAEQAII